MTDPLRDRTVRRALLKLADESNDHDQADMLRYAAQTVALKDKFTEAMASVGKLYLNTRKSVWTMAGGDVTLEWPTDLSVADADALQEYLNLAMKFIRRTAEENARTTPTDAGLESSPVKP